MLACSLQSAVCSLRLQLRSSPWRGGFAGRVVSGGPFLWVQPCGAAKPCADFAAYFSASTRALPVNSLSACTRSTSSTAAHIKHATNAAPPRPDWNRRQIAEEGGASPTLVDVQEQPLCSQSALPRRFGAANAKASGVAFLLARRGIGWTLDRWQQLATNQTRGPGPPFKALDAASPPVSRP